MHISLYKLTLLHLVIATGLFCTTASASPSASQAIDLDYTVLYDAETPDVVQIELIFSGDASGSTQLTLCGDDAWAGIETCATHIAALAVKGSNGKLRATRFLGEDRWRIDHEPGEALHVSYRILANRASEANRQNEINKPVIANDFFYFVGHTALIYPVHLSDPAPRTIRLNHRALGVKEWRAVCSLEADQSGQWRVKMPLKDFRHMFFFAGNMALFKRKLGAKHLVIALASGHWPKLASARLIETIERMARFQRNAFMDNSASRDLIAIVPDRPGLPMNLLVNGIKVSGGFALVLPQAATLEQNSESARQIYRLLAHEQLHSWLGDQLKMPENSAELAWFSEGITNHLTRAFLYRSGLFSLEDYLINLNRVREAYRKSPVKTATNQAIARDFFHNPALRALPYYRGDLLAYLIDAEIRAHSRSRRTLIDWLRALVRASVPGKPLSNEWLYTSLKPYASQEFITRLRDLVESGTPIELPPDLLAPCLNMRSPGPSSDQAPVFVPGSKSSRCPAIL